MKVNTVKQSIPMMRIEIVIEPDGDCFFGWSPDLEGIMVEGETEEETKNFLGEAILVHIEGLLKNNLPLPSQILVHESTHSKQKHQKYYRSGKSSVGSTQIKTGTTELQMSLVA